MTAPRVTPGAAVDDPMDSTEDIARHIARENWKEEYWGSYHPIVKATVEWLQERGYLLIVKTRDQGDRFL